MFDFWATEKLGQMLQVARQRAREAEEKFIAAQREDRRNQRCSFEKSKENAAHLRRVEDQVRLMQTELRRRTLAECQGEPSQDALLEYAVSLLEPRTLTGVDDAEREAS